LSVAWSRVSSPSGFRNVVFSVCVSSGRVFAVGFDESLGYGVGRFRVESYSSRDGKLLASWVDEKGYPLAALTTCTSMGGFIYAVGYTSRFWSIIVFDRDLKIHRRTDFKEPCLAPFSAVIVGKDLYVAGSNINPGGSTALSVVKVPLDELVVEKAFTESAGGAGAGAYAVVYNSKVNQLAVGGFINSEEELKWLLVLLDKDLENAETIKPGVEGSVLGLAVDTEGSYYAVDGHRLAKLAASGELLKTIEVPGVKVHASRDEKSPLGRYVTVIAGSEVYVLRNDLTSTVDSAKLMKEPGSLAAVPGSMDSDDGNIYFALTRVVSRDKWDWAVYALRVKIGGKRWKILFGPRS